MITTLRPRDSQQDASRRHIASIAMLTLSLVTTFFNALPAAEPLSHQDKFAQRLREPHTGLVDGQTLRLAIQMVARSPSKPELNLNTWLDRKVDPDAPVSLVELGPTRYASLSAVADSAGCACYPVDNCIVIGRPAWVAELSREFYLGSENPTRRIQSGNSTIDLKWPMLTTPREALQLIRGHSVAMGPAASSLPQLPHDLWPAADLRDISPRLAERLVVGQFTDGAESSRINYPFGRSYRFPNAKTLLDSLVQIDPNVNMKSIGAKTRLIGSPAAHQLFCRKVLSVATGGPVQADDPAGDALERLRSSKRTFSMPVKNKPAGQVLNALLTKIGIPYEFAGDANQTLQQLVSFSAVDQSPWQIVQLITNQVPLKIEASGGKLRISVGEKL